MGAVVTGVDTDIALVRSALKLDVRVPGGNDGPLAALASVEAELFRLREHKISLMRRCARLQQALAKADKAASKAHDAMWAMDFDKTSASSSERDAWKRLREQASDAIWTIHNLLRPLMAREALAGPGSEQSSLTESGSAGLPDTPADSPTHLRSGAGLGQPIQQDEPWILRPDDHLGRWERQYASAKLAHAALNLTVDEGDDMGDHVGMQRHRRAVATGQAEMLAYFTDEARTADPPPFPDRLYPADSQEDKT